MLYSGPAAWSEHRAVGLLEGPCVLPWTARASLRLAPGWRGLCCESDGCRGILRIMSRYPATGPRRLNPVCVGLPLPVTLSPVLSHYSGVELAILWPHGVEWTLRRGVVHEARAFYPGRRGPHCVSCTPRALRGTMTAPWRGVGPCHGIFQRPTQVYPACVGLPLARHPLARPEPLQRLSCALAMWRPRMTACRTHDRH